VTDLVLIYESVTSSMKRRITYERRLHSDSILFYESLTSPPFIPRCEPNIEHYLQPFTLFHAFSLLRKYVFISWAHTWLVTRCLSMDIYSVFDNGTSAMCLPSRCLAIVICVTICRSLRWCVGVSDNVCLNSIIGFKGK
jgi:hypothetical protein